MARMGEEIDGLEAYFAASRAEAPEPSAALLLRIEADGARIAAERNAHGRVRPAKRFWHAFSLALGGRGAVAGLLTATLAGLWLGFSPPAILSSFSQTVTQSVLGTSSPATSGLDLMPSLDSVLTQG